MSSSFFSLLIVFINHNSHYHNHLLLQNHHQTLGAGYKHFLFLHKLFLFSILHYCYHKNFFLAEQTNHIVFLIYCLCVLKKQDFYENILHNYLRKQILLFYLSKILLYYLYIYYLLLIVFSLCKSILIV